MERKDWFDENNLVPTRVLGRGPKMNKNETLYKEVKCKVQCKLHDIQDT